MSVLGSVNHQPNEIEDVDVDFGEWVPQGDSLQDVVVSVRLLRGEGTPPLVADNIRVSQSWVCKVRIRGGAHDSRWRVQLRFNTVGGLAKEGEFDVVVKEV